MAKVLGNKEKTEWLVFCPACKCGHMFRTPPWTFNGDKDKPTFRASMLVRHFKVSPEGEDMICRGEKPVGGKYPGKDIVCHSFVTDGKIEFLGDCNHDLCGKTVELPDF